MLYPASIEEDDEVLYPEPLAHDQALHALAEIRSVIDRTTRYSTFSALSGFLAGVAALAGSGICGMLKNFVGAQPERGMPFAMVWGVVFLFAATAQFVLTALKARQRGESLWTPIARTAFATLAGPALAGAAGSLVFIQTGHFELLPGLWLLLYGCGLWAVSFFAPLFIRMIGVAFIVLGLCAWLFTPLAALWLGLGFGGLHLLFGAIVWTRYQR